MKDLIKKGYIYVNGILLSPRAIEVIDSLQTGGTINWDNWDGRKFSNEGLTDNMEKLNQIEKYFQQLMLDDDQDVQTGVKMLRNLSDIRWLLESLQITE